MILDSQKLFLQARNHQSFTTVGSELDTAPRNQVGIPSWLSDWVWGRVYTSVFENHLFLLEIHLFSIDHGPRLPPSHATNDQTQPADGHQVPPISGVFSRGKSMKIYRLDVIVNDALTIRMKFTFRFVEFFVWRSWNSCGAWKLRPDVVLFWLGNSSRVIDKLQLSTSTGFIWFYYDDEKVY